MELPHSQLCQCRECRTNRVLTVYGPRKNKRVISKPKFNKPKRRSYPDYIPGFEENVPCRCAECEIERLNYLYGLKDNKNDQNNKDKLIRKSGTEYLFIGINEYDDDELLWAGIKFDDIKIDEKDDAYIEKLVDIYGLNKPYYIYSKIRNYDDLLKLGVANTYGLLNRTPWYTSNVVFGSSYQDTIKLLDKIRLVNSLGMYTVEGQGPECYYGRFIHIQGGKYIDSMQRSYLTGYMKIDEWNRFKLFLDNIVNTKNINCYYNTCFYNSNKCDTNIPKNRVVVTKDRDYKNKNNKPVYRKYTAIYKGCDDNSQEDNLAFSGHVGIDSIPSVLKNGNCVFVSLAQSRWCFDTCEDIVIDFYRSINKIPIEYRMQPRSNIVINMLTSK